VIPLVLLFTQTVQAEGPPIIGAFGIKLGDSPKSDYRTQEVPTKLGKLYFVKPPIKNEHFNEYAVLVTFSTNKIFRIYAEKEQSSASCKVEVLKVKESLEKIYGTLSVTDNVFTFKQQNKEINLTCKVSKINNNESSLQIKYVDHQVYNDSHKKLKPIENDSSGL